MLVIAANRGIGVEFIAQLQQRGAAKTYAAARKPATVQTTGVEALRLGVTDPDEVAEVHFD